MTDTAKTTRRSPTLSGLDRAQKSADILWERDQASQWLGFKVADIAEGRATLLMVIKPHHCNGHGTCHGGIIFALADSAFAFACNSRNQNTVAQHNFITYIASPRAGTQLTATAREVSLTGRNGIYDVEVNDDQGQRIAEFRGLSRAVKGMLFEEGRGEDEEPGAK